MLEILTVVTLVGAAMATATQVGIMFYQLKTKQEKLNHKSDLS